MGGEEMKTHLVLRREEENKSKKKKKKSYHNLRTRIHNTKYY